MTDLLSINHPLTIVTLLSEGEHVPPIDFFGIPIMPMRIKTFYFVIIVLVIVDLIQSKYQKKIIKLEQVEENGTSNNEHE